ncbi:hypothetical protein H0A64_07160 [Alcaligenaceae bacterium]|nr:hypothetical protein [Alcaligenaceae bacterium]
MVSQIGGAAAGGIGAFFGSGTQKANLRGAAAVSEANARIADTNARIAELGAQSALDQGQKQVGALTMRAGQLKSAQRVGFAANGIDVGTGSAAEVQATTDIMKEIDSNTLTANAVRTAWGYRTQGINAQTQAMNLRNDALSKRSMGSAISPIGAATTSLLGNAGNVASSWYHFKKEGAL